MFRVLVTHSDAKIWSGEAKQTHDGVVSELVRDAVNDRIRNRAALASGARAIMIDKATADRLLGSGRTADELINNALDREEKPPEPEGATS